MEKRISYDQFQSVKRVAQACNPLMVKRDKIKAKIEALTREYNDYDTQISSLEAGIKQVVGFRVEQLIKKVIEPGIDVNGQPKKTTKYLPTDIVSYDDAKKQYVISVPSEPAADSSFVGETLEPVISVGDAETAAPADIAYSESSVPTDAPIFD